MLGFSTQQPDALRHVVRWDEGYAVPRSGGRIVVGSTVEPDSGFAKGNTPDAIERLTAAFRSALPGIAAERKHAWSGLRPASADELPILGFAAEGLLYACGHYRNGILLTPVTAQAIADLAEGKRPALALDAFSPSRPALAAASIVVNGSARSIAPGTTVAALLSELALKRQGVAVAINEEVVRRGEWDSTVLKRSDRVEIIHAVGGG
jgi:thiamine biosynthesis protein ThiS